MSHASGEDAVVEVLQRHLGGTRTGLAGPGDDGAMLQPSDGRVVACDTMVEGVHWSAQLSTPFDVGAKLVASNVSDIYAMGAVPSAMVLAATFGPASWNVEEFARGMAFARDHIAPGLELVGGDTTRGPCFVFSLTVVGRVATRAVGRRGARPGQRLWCDGPLGHAAAGLALLRCDASAEGELVDAHRRALFDPPEVSLWGDAGVTAAIDISDGLSLDAWRLASASGVGLVLEAPLPGIDALVDAGHRLSVDPMHWQLAGGDDYVRLVASDRSPGPNFTPIGRVEAGHPGLTLAMTDGTSRALNPDGYRHDRGLLRSSEPEA